jgi:hypothetical protein
MKKLYGNVLNLSGLYAKNPVELKSVDGVWWDSSLNIDFKGPGLEIKDRLIKFAGTEREVECFSMGARACFKLLRQWAWCPLNKGK